MVYDLDFAVAKRFNTPPEKIDIELRVVKVVDIKFIKRNVLALIVAILTYFLTRVLLDRQPDIYEVLMFTVFFIVVLNIFERLSRPKKGEA